MDRQRRMRKLLTLSSSSLFLFLSFLLLLLLFTVSSAMADNASGSRIMGGAAASITEAPYLVSLRQNGRFICGGSLISTMHVLTAAHCVKGVPAHNLEIRGGITQLYESSGVRRSVVKVITPKAYRENTLHMDVAVLKLSSAIADADVGPIELCNVTLRAGYVVRVLGWGLTSENRASVSTRLRAIDVPLIGKQTCVRRYKGRGQVTNTMFCASNRGAKDACTGDSGGPATYKGRLCGIVSWGIGCGRLNSPGVYTNVNKVKSFIAKAMTL